MDIVITLAGKSRRFKSAGYTKPKFLLEIDGKPILLRVIEMFSREDTFHFIFNNEQIPNNPEITDIINSTYESKIKMLDANGTRHFNSLLQTAKDSKTYIG